MTVPSLISLTITEAARLIRDRELSPVELTEAYLTRIDEVEPIVRGFAFIDRDHAIAEAHRVADELARGGWKGPLHGIPVGVKDIIDTADLPTRYGSKAFDDRRPQRDAFAVTRLRQAGAVLIGKNTTQECAVGIACAPTTNPWDTGRVAGGSSGGSAAAVAAGECAVSVGSDTGGSIRIPAAFCGVVGLRPTGGVVSRSGVLPAATSFDRVGPIARTAGDAGILLDALTGHDPADPASDTAALAHQRRGASAPLRGARIGVIREWAEDADPAVAEAFATAEAIIREHGAELVDVTCPLPEMVMPTYQAVALHELAAQHISTVRTRSHLYSPEVLEVIRAGEGVDADSHARAKADLGRISRAWRSLFADHDLAACVAPTVPITACTPEELPALEARAGAFTIPVSLADLPVVTQPMGRPGGLPAGVQWIGPPFEENRLLGFAREYEQSTDWHLTPAPIPGKDVSSPMEASS
ncbi:amidase [Actinomadura sp.]|uniref:amidase n=1 Tax=Actinomadura sp. TaxID=1989 RepID=UPI0037CBD7C5